MSEGDRDARGVPAQGRLMHQVLGDNRLAQTVGPTMTMSAAGSRKSKVNSSSGNVLSICLGPVVIEVDERLKLARLRIISTALKAAELPLVVFDFEHAREPEFGDEFLGVGRQAVEVEPA
jgi:hypothetical protein